VSGSQRNLCITMTSHSFTKSGTRLKIKAQGKELWSTNSKNSYKSSKNSNQDLRLRKEVLDQRILQRHRKKNTPKIYDEELLKQIYNDANGKAIEKEAHYLSSDTCSDSDHEHNEDINDGRSMATLKR
jgi:hypothetical protein